MELDRGPILSFRGATATTWRVSALWVRDVTAPAPAPTASHGAVVTPAVALARSGARKAWRVDISVNRPASREIYVDYGLPGGAQHWFAVPAKSQPIQSGFASCNGFSDPKYKKKITAPRNARWESLFAKHKREPLHLLMLGGDQVYGDSIWRDCDLKWLAAWLDLGKKERALLDPSGPQRDALFDFYFDLYCARWAQENVSDALASIPSLMMWDDHDIFDGWGSHDASLQDTKVFKAVFAAADAAFRVFQLQVKPTELPAGSIAGAALSYVQLVDDLGIVVLDLRSERTPQQVMSAKAWSAALDAIDRVAAAKPRHLFVISGPPVVFPSASSFERVIDAIPGEQDVEDDLRDRWGSEPHLAARETLVRRLLAAAAANRVRVTILSGDVHMAALGVIESNHSPTPTHANVINNLVSSPIVHAPPSKIAILALKLLDEEFKIGRGVKATMLPMPGSRKPYIARRNFMRLLCDKDRLITAEWCFEHPEGEKIVRKTINPVP